MKRTVVLLAVLIFCFQVALAQDKHFERIEKFPQGDQTSLVAPLFEGMNATKAEQYTFDVPYEKVWAAANRTAQTFARIGGRAVVSVDTQTGKIQNGKISQDGTIGLGDTSWLDECLIQMTRLTSTLTNVMVARKVVEKNSVNHQWKTYMSNGKVERWLLTQIEDEIKNDGADYSQSAPGKYIRENQKEEYFELKPNGTLNLHQGGKDYEGQYEVAGNIITFVLGKHRVVSRGKVQSGIIIGPRGDRYVKEGGAPETLSSPLPAPVTSSAPISPEILTNAEVIRMVAAKLPESLIITKIRSSTCKFDTSTDALIRLKQAGVSDSVLQAMTETASK